MTYAPTQPSSNPPHRSRSLRTGAKDASASAGRRRRALVQLAQRHGEVRVSVRDATGVRSAAVEVLDLLDQLNEGGLLRYGGLQRSGPRIEVVYHAA